MFEQNRLSREDMVEMLDTMRSWVAELASPLIYMVLSWTVFLGAINFLASR